MGGQAIKSANVAYKSALANLKNGNIKKFELKNKDTRAISHIKWVEYIFTTITFFLFYHSTQ